MSGEGVGKEVVSKNLQHEKRAFDERTVACEKIIVPEKLSGKGGHSDRDADHDKEQRAQPGLTGKLGETGQQFRGAECGTNRGESVHLEAMPDFGR